MGGLGGLFADSSLWFGEGAMTLLYDRLYVLSLLKIVQLHALTHVEWIRPTLSHCISCMTKARVPASGRYPPPSSANRVAQRVRLDFCRLHTYSLVCRGLFACLDTIMVVCTDRAILGLEGDGYDHGACVLEECI